MLYKTLLSTDTVQVSCYHRGEGHVAAVDPGQSKVSQLHLALTGYQNILWFQVSVHHAVRVKECKTTQQLFHQVLQKNNTGIFQLKLNISTEHENML